MQTARHSIVGRLTDVCGIVGYVGGKPALEVVMDGLRRLEYRGYDSAGVALVADGDLFTAKRAGKLGCLEVALKESGSDDASAVHDRHRAHPLGHPRRADRPQLPPASRRRGRVAVVHNGIIENFAGLRAELESKGREMRSETDTEVVAQLLEVEMAKGKDLTTAMQAVCRRLDGAFTLVAACRD